MTYPLESRVFSNETLVAGTSMLGSHDQRQLLDCSENGLEEELNRLKAPYGFCFSILYASCLCITNNLPECPIHQAMKQSMEAGIAVIPTPVRNGGAEQAGPTDDTVPADLPTPPWEDPTLVSCL